MGARHQTRILDCSDPSELFQNERTPSASLVAQIFNLPYRRFSTGTAHPKLLALISCTSARHQPRVMECVRFSAAFQEQTNHKPQPNTQPPPEKKDRPSLSSLPGGRRSAKRSPNLGHPYCGGPGRPLGKDEGGPFPDAPFQISNFKFQILRPHLSLLTPSHYCHIVL